MAPPKAEKKITKVPEAVLKARKRRSNNAKEKKRVIRSRIIQKKANRNLAFARAEKYVREYRAKEADEIRLKRMAKKEGNFYVPAEPKVALVVRIRGVNGISPKPRKVLQLLRLLQINNAVLIKLNKATINMLRLAEPFVAWGYPNLKTIRELIYKRGFVKVHGKRTPLMNNSQVEKELGRYGIMCVEDMVHEIATCGKNFTQVSNFLWPFKLNNPNGGWKKKTNHFVEGGDFGNRENQINRLMRTMV